MNVVNHLVLSVVAVIAATDISFAQAYSIIPNDTFKISGMMEDQQTLTISQLNTSGNIITLGWEKISESVPVGWDASVCDNRLCYGALEDSGTMNPIIPSETSFLLLKITGHVNYGIAVIRYAVWNVNNPTMRDTLTYVMTIQNTGIAEKVMHPFTIFPNPANDLVNIQSRVHTKFTCSLMDLTGKEVQTGHSNANSIILSTENLPNGIYFLKLIPVDSKLYNGFFVQKIIIQ